MQVISHRGYWKEAKEKNSVIAFERSFRYGFGTETDLRDYLGDIVISHDIANRNAVTLHEMLKVFCRHDKKQVLALNIKADGLQQKLNVILQEFAIDNYFVFDMSVPDTIGYIKEGLHFFSRQSEYEPKPVFYEQCMGIWLDAFNSNWYDTTVIKQHLDNKKQVAIVSPDLHKRNVLPLWEKLKGDRINEMEGVILCTDIPEEAVNFFK